VQLIIIDEIHNYLPTRATSTPTQAVSFLKNLMNRTKVPVLFMGTHEAERLISFYDEMASRIRPRVVRFNNFSISTPERLYEFAQVLEAFAELLSQAGESFSFFKLEDGVQVLAQENLLKRIFVATDGNLRNVRDLFYKMVDAVQQGQKPTLEGFANIWQPAMNERLGFNPFIQANDKKVAKHILNINNVKGH
ncbi:MAG: TniB family NTP-binding protein, partial [Gammaproteobacteria bacterium]|nr:TniB family NTP-binding protein [Gammaproteobacteria bacterium]MBU1555767.1 TniB family NTP-binding protein [Gammaproteobacteria bacterium]